MVQVMQLHLQSYEKKYQNGLSYENQFLPQKHLLAKQRLSRPSCVQGRAGLCGATEDVEMATRWRPNPGKLSPILAKGQILVLMPISRRQINTSPIDSSPRYFSFYQNNSRLSDTLYLAFFPPSNRQRKRNTYIPSFISRLTVFLKRCV